MAIEPSWHATSLKPLLQVTKLDTGRSLKKKLNKNANILPMHVSSSVCWLLWSLPLADGARMQRIDMLHMFCIAINLYVYVMLSNMHLCHVHVCNGHVHLSKDRFCGFINMYTKLVELFWTVYKTISNVSNL